MGHDPLVDFIRHIHIRLRKRLSVSINLSGETGSGKSTLAIDIIKMYNHMKPPHARRHWKECLFYEAAEMQKALASLEMFNIVVLNEGDTIFNREWQSKGNISVSKSQGTDRIFGIAKIWITPDMRTMETNVNRTQTGKLHCEMTDNMNIEHARRVCSGWLARPPSPFPQHGRPSGWMDLYFSRYSFPRLHPDVEADFEAWDRKEKERLNLKYRKMIKEGKKQTARAGRPSALPVNPDLSGTTAEVAERYGVSIPTAWRAISKLKTAPP